MSLLFLLILEGFLSRLLAVLSQGYWWVEMGINGSVKKKKNAYIGLQTHAPRTPGPPKRNAPVICFTAGADSLALGPLRSGWNWNCVRRAREFNSCAKPETSQTAPPEAETGRRAFPIDPNAGPPKSDQGEAEPMQNPIALQRFAWLLAPKPTTGPSPAGSTRHVSHVTDNPPPR